LLYKATREAASRATAPSECSERRVCVQCCSSERYPCLATIFLISQAVHTRSAVAAGKKLGSAEGNSVRNTEHSCARRRAQFAWARARNGRSFVFPHSRRCHKDCDQPDHQPHRKQCCFSVNPVASTSRHRECATSWEKQSTIPSTASPQRSMRDHLQPALRSAQLHQPR